MVSGVKKYLMEGEGLVKLCRLFPSLCHRSWELLRPGGALWLF